jgi:hypothetical protein
MAGPLSMPVWQNVLLVHGCGLDIGSEVLPLKLEVIGDCVQCTPTSSGSMLPFHVPVRMGQTVTITWDCELSRYVVQSMGKKTAA